MDDPGGGISLFNDADAKRLFLIAQAFERLRRVFAGDLLKGPPLEVPKVASK